MMVGRGVELSTVTVYEYRETMKIGKQQDAPEDERKE
jgi:hypothetical protein